jgi:hypothetical protein
MAHQGEDDDFLTANVPDPDAEPTPAELKRAKAFAELVDKAIAGRTPPALSADDRALLEVATVIRATSGAIDLAASRQRNIVEDALRQAVGDHPSTSLSTTPISAARSKRRWVPWAVAATSTAVAAAAVLMLWLRKPVERPIAQREVPTEWRSRPADPLIGRITPERAGEAAARLDHIFADRLGGYRDRMLSRGGAR